MSSQSPDEFWPLEQRLRSIENELDRRALANPDPPGRGALQQPSRPPRVTGLTLSSDVIGGIVANWNGVSISNLKRYEVQISETVDMVGAQTFFTRETQYAFSGITSGVEYYVRVRAINASESTGDYSTILSSIRGAIGTEDIQEGAITDRVWEDLDDILIETPRVWFETGAIEEFVAVVNSPITIQWQLRLGGAATSAGNFNIFTGIQVFDGSDYIRGAPEEGTNFLVDLRVPFDQASDPISFHSYSWTINPGVGIYRISHWMNKDDSGGTQFLEVKSQFIIASQAKR